MAYRFPSRVLQEGNSLLNTVHLAAGSEAVNNGKTVATQAKNVIFFYPQNFTS